jgi:hypothetical protein
MNAGVVELAGQQSAGASAAWWPVAAVIGGLVLAVVVWMAWRQWRRGPAERAFVKLARGLGLGWRERRAARMAARRRGFPAVALLLCPSALGSTAGDGVVDCLQPSRRGTHRRGPDVPR